VLIPPCFIALGGLLSFAWPDAFERHWLVAILGTAAACTMVLVGAFDPYLQVVSESIAHQSAVVGCALFAIGLLAYVVRPGISASILVIVVFAVGNRLVARTPMSYLASDRCKVQPEVYTAVVDAASWLSTVDPTHTRARSWFDQNERTEPIAGCPVVVGWIGG